MKTVIFFTSPTCGPCKLIKPIVQDMMEDNSDFSWMFVDITNDSANLAQRFAIQYVPTMVALCNNQEVGRHTGSQAMGYYHLLKNLRNNRA